MGKGGTGEKAQALYQVTIRVTLRIMSMLLVDLFVLEQATTPTLRVQTSTKAGLHNFKLPV